MSNSMVDYIRSRFSATEVDEGTFTIGKIAMQQVRSEAERRMYVTDEENGDMFNGRETVQFNENSRYYTQRVRVTRND